MALAGCRPARPLACWPMSSSMTRVPESMVVINAEKVEGQFHLLGWAGRGPAHHSNDRQLGPAGDLDAVAPPRVGAGGLFHVQVHPVATGPFELEDLHLDGDLDAGRTFRLAEEGLKDVGQDGPRPRFEGVDLPERGCGGRDVTVAHGRLLGFGTSTLPDALARPRAEQLKTGGE